MSSFEFELVAATVVATAATNAKSEAASITNLRFIAMKFFVVEIRK
jgi:hypothetical protein